MGKVKTAVTLVSPGDAAQMLHGNKRNRNVSQQLVSRYARDMQAGNWQQNGSAIVFNGDGTLLDGQHRLLACVQSGVPFSSVVIRGVESDAIATLDTGRPRKLSDILTMQGERSSRTLAAVLRQGIVWGNSDSGVVPNRGAGWIPSYSEQLAFLERWPEARDATAIADRPRPRGLAGGLVGALALNLIVAIDDREYVDSFFQGVMQGNSSQSTPAYTLWRLFVKWAAETGTRREGVYYLALMVKAWNASVTGNVPSNWRWRRAGTQAEAFPTLLDLDGQPIEIVN
jgi:hypothetical protein